MDIIKEFAPLPGCLFVIFALGYGLGIFTCQRHPEQFDIHTKEETVLIITEDATTVSETTNKTEVTTVTTTYTMTTVESETIADVTNITDTMTYLGDFGATYYKGDSVPCYGGSGRMLVSCYEKCDGYKGSIASRWVYGQYGYELNGKTMVYIEFDSYPRLNGWYSVDDRNADPSIVDFYFADYTTCPWQNDGVTGCRMWIGGI